MVPAQPPLPTAWYLPFHPALGSQTSILMSESDEGVSVAATRQYAGSISGGAPAGAPPRPAAGIVAASSARPAPRPAGDGGTNGPAGTTVASVIATFGSFSAVRFAHGVAANADDALSMSARSIPPACVVMGLPRVCSLSQGCDSTARGRAVD